MILRLLLLLFIPSGLCSCESNPDQKPLELVWGRETGEVSFMVVSDPRYAVQIIDQAGRGYFFVEIGTAVQWLAARKTGEKEKIWVNDFSTQNWIDARSAHWKSGFKGSPMGFGYRAFQAQPDENLTFTEIFSQILSEGSLIKKHKQQFRKNN